MRVGLVSPYPWDSPGGVVAHINDLAVALMRMGHEVQVMSPVDDESYPLPDWVTRAGRGVPVRYNGSVSRLTFGPVSAARLRRWLHDGDFDVLHLHSPETFSLSLLCLMNASGPIVATFHAANPRSRILAALQTPLQVYLERVSARIAVSAKARQTIVEHLGGDAVVVPNGVEVASFAGATALPGFPREGGTLAFLGRIDEPRKGLSVLLDAMALLIESRPQLRLLVAGPGDVAGLADRLPVDLREHVRFLGRVSEEDKARVYASADVFVAPNTGGESFGIVLLESMATGTPIVASRLDAFASVLEQGRLGAMADVGDPVSLAGEIAALLDDPPRRAQLREAGLAAVGRYDWSIVADEVVRVYETAVATATGRVVETPEESLLA